MKNDDLHPIVESIIHRVIKNGKVIRRDKAEPVARAFKYLHERGVKLPRTIDDAKKLSPREQYEFRVFCAASPLWADENALTIYNQAAGFLALIKSSIHYSARGGSVREDRRFRAWSPSWPRGVFTKRDWQQKSRR